MITDEMIDDALKAFHRPNNWPADWPTDDLEWHRRKMRTVIETNFPIIRNEALEEAAVVAIGYDLTIQSSTLADVRAREIASAIQALKVKK